MTLPTPLFYTLTDVANRWGRTEDDLMQWGATGAIRLAFCCDFRNAEILVRDEDVPGGCDEIEHWISDSYLYVHEHTIKRVVAGFQEKPGMTLPTSTEFIEKIGRNITGIDLHPLLDNDPDFDTRRWGKPLPLITKDILVVMPEELKHMEAEYPELAGQNETIDELPSVGVGSSGLQQILDPSHPWYSEPLANSIKAWLDLYANREGNRNDNLHRPKEGNTKYINKWLRENVDRDIGETTSSHYSFIINPSKQGGPRKIPE